MDGWKKNEDVRPLFQATPSSEAGEQETDVLDDAEDMDDTESVPVEHHQTQPQKDGPAHGDDPEGRVALITGGAAGLGMAVAMELARRGWSIFIQHSPAQPSVAEAKEAILSAAQQAEQEIEVQCAPADLTSSSQREQLVEQVLESFDRIDMLVNAAAPPGDSSDDLLELAESDFRAVLDSSLTATFFLTQRVANEMVRLVEAGRIESPRIVTINSMHAYVTSADWASHCLSQAAIAMMTKLFADRLGEHGINVYEVRTGIISVGPADQSRAKYDSLIAQGLTPIRRWGRPGDVARAVAAIASDLLDFSTGEVLNVDGGFHIQRL